MISHEKTNYKTLPPRGGSWRGVIILGDGMADHKQESLGFRTPLEVANIPTIDLLAKEGKTGRLITVPEGFPPGSEVANTAILGYDLDTVYEGRGPLEAASIGYEMQPDDLALRCNIIALKDGKIKNHHGGHLQTEEARKLIACLNEHLAGEYTLTDSGWTQGPPLHSATVGADLVSARKTACVKFIPGIQYRHLLIIKGGNKHIVCAPPHDHPDEPWRPLLPKASSHGECVSFSLGESVEIVENKKEPSTCSPNSPRENNAALSSSETAALLTDLILKSQDILKSSPRSGGCSPSGNEGVGGSHGGGLLSIWPWSGGYRPSMQTLLEQFPQIRKGAVITAVDLIKGIGHYAGLDIIEVPGATGLADTNYEGKAAAAIQALKDGNDFVFVHVEATDEAGHDGDIDLKIKATEYLDRRIVKPIHDYAMSVDDDIRIAVLPDHPTPCETRTHVGEPVPFLIWHKGIQPDSVQEYNEQSCVSGEYGLLRLRQFIETFMRTSI